jgi:hypothetical protein
MSDTPERIWLGQNMNGWIAIEYRPNWVQLPEYIRADRIEALQSEVESFRTAAALAGPALQKALREIEALIAERDEAICGNHRSNEYEPTWAELTGAWKARAEAAEADSKRLREALTVASQALDDAGDELNELADALSREPRAAFSAYKSARIAAALTGKETK